MINNNHQQKNNNLENDGDDVGIEAKKNNKNNELSFSLQFYI